MMTNMMGQTGARQGIGRDPHRPGYHFLPPANWMNDPNGLIDWGGQYHLFYQYNPDGPRWGNIHWGHAGSTDLVHWTDLPIALAPEPGGPDQDGCWSGCAVEDDSGVPVILYTGVRNGQQRPCLATGGGDLLSWQRYAGNPVIAEPPENLDLIGFRDHTVWREDGAWCMGIGAGVYGAGGAVLLYRSADLRHWEYDGPLVMSDTEYLEGLWAGSMWECPNLIWLGDTPLLIFSAWQELRTAYSIVVTGSYEDGRFHPAQASRLDYGDNHFYAPQVMIDRHGRHLAWAWIQEGRSQEAQDRAGWSGVMSLPRQLSLSAGGLLEMQPAAELHALRGEHRRAEGLDLAPGAFRPVVEGSALEIEAVFEHPAAGQCGLSLRRSPGGEEQTLLYYDAEQGLLALDRRHASLDASVASDAQSGAFALDPDEPLRLHVFLDNSVIEVFANDRACLTSRIYPARPDSLGISPFALGRSARLVSFDAWRMDSIWTGREQGRAG